MNRNEFPRPFQQSMIDYNGNGALTATGRDLRPYPRYRPVPFHSISASCTDWTFEAYRENLSIFAELYFVVGRELAMDEQNIGQDAILGYGVGLCVLDDALHNTIRNGSDRDYNLAETYAQYADDAHILLPEIYPITDISNIKIKISSPTLGEHVFDQAHLNWDGLKLLNGISPLNAAKKYDLVMLGASDAPIVVPEDVHFAEGEAITIDAGVLGKGAIKVHDLRDKNVSAPTWKPRAYACEPEYLDVN